MNPKVDLTLRVLVAAAVTFIGIIPKFTGNPEMIANFARWGYPDGFHLVVGAAEALGVLLLLVPATARYGGALIAVLMLGALITHLKVGEYGLAPIPVVVGGLAVWTAWPRWKGRRRR